MVTASAPGAVSPHLYRASFHSGRFDAQVMLAQSQYTQAKRAVGCEGCKKLWQRVLSVQVPPIPAEAQNVQRAWTAFTSCRECPRLIQEASQIYSDMVRAKGTIVSLLGELKNPATSAARQEQLAGQVERLVQKNSGGLQTISVLVRVAVEAAEPVSKEVVMVDG